MAVDLIGLSLSIGLIVPTTTSSFTINYGLTLGEWEHCGLALFSARAKSFCNNDKNSDSGSFSLTSTDTLVFLNSVTDATVELFLFSYWTEGLTIEQLRGITSTSLTAYSTMAAYYRFNSLIGA